MSSLYRITALSGHLIPTEDLRRHHRLRRAFIRSGCVIAGRFETLEQQLLGFRLKSKWRGSYCPVSGMSGDYRGWIHRVQWRMRPASTSTPRIPATTGDAATLCDFGQAGLCYKVLAQMTYLGEDAPILISQFECDAINSLHLTGIRVVCTFKDALAFIRQ